MALQIHALTSKPYHHHQRNLLITSTKIPKFTIKSQQNPQIETSDDPSPSSKKQPTSPGVGFGDSEKPKSSGVSDKKKAKGKRERASVIRREPVEKPTVFVSGEEAAKAEEQRKNENAFLLAWLGLGGVILVQGIALAASGFLPEEWDKFFVKYLYPSFTPTVGLFVAGTVAYGVLKYLQNEKLKDQK